MKTKTRKGFTMIPNELGTNWQLSNAAFRMYFILCSHDLNLFKINCAVLYSQMNISTKTGEKMMKELLESGLVNRTKTLIAGRYVYNYAITSSNFSTGSNSTGRKVTAIRRTIKEEQSVPLKEEKHLIFSSNIEALTADNSVLNKEAKERIESVKEIYNSMIPDNIYEEFYKPLEPVIPVKETITSSVERDSLGLTLEARKHLSHRLTYTNVKDLSMLYPDMSDSISALWESIGKPDVKSVEVLTFSEFWEQNKFGNISERDKSFFQQAIGLWKDMTLVERIKALRDFKSKMDRGTPCYIILMETVDPQCHLKRQELEKKDDNFNSSDNSF